MVIEGSRKPHRGQETVRLRNCAVWRSLPCGQGKEMWYAVWVRTGQEEKVLRMCRKMLPEQCFLPRYERARKQDSRWTRVEKPLFPGYLFFDSGNVEVLTDRLKKTPEFTRVLGDGSKPIALHPHEVAFLEKYTNEDRLMEMSCGFLEGDRLVVTHGPLKDYEGKIVHINRHKRLATLEVEFFGRTIRVEVGVEVVMKV